MSKVGIITDSIHGLSADIIQKYDIRIAPMGVIIGSKAYRDTIDITAEQFYPLFRESKAPCSTNAATPGDFLNIFDSLSKKTDSMVYIGVSKALTATYNVALQSKQMYLEDHSGVKIELIDSKNCMGALGFTVLEAARAAEAGKSLMEIVALVQNMLPRIKYLSVLDTLRYLLKIGRIPQSAASEEKLKYRPMIGMTNNSGLMESFPAVPVEQAMEKLVSMVGQYLQPGRPVHMIVHHSEYMDEAAKIKAMVIGTYRPTEIYVTEYSPAALVSTGLMSGISFYS